VLGDDAAAVTCADSNDLYRLGHLSAKLTGCLLSTFAVIYGSMQKSAERRYGT
jgi:hypothetical protein